MRKIICAVAILSIIMTIMVKPCSAKMVVKLGHVDPADPFMSADHSAAVVFKTMVETATNGDIEVRIYPSSSLGSGREQMVLLKNDIIQVYLATAGNIATMYPLIGVLDTPFAIPNMSTAWAVFDGWFGEKIKKSIYEKTGLICLEILDQGGFFHFTNNKRPIRTLADIKGIKFRTMTLPSHISFFRSMEASAIPIAWAEVYTALETGVVDGQHNPISPILGSKLYEVQKYLTLSGHIWSTHWFMVNDQWYQSLTHEEKQIVRNAANVAKVCGRGITKIYECSDKGMALIQKKTEVNQLSIDEKEKFGKVTIPAMKKFIKNSLGEEGIALQNDFLKAIAEVRAKLEY